MRFEQDQKTTWESKPILMISNAHRGQGVLELLHRTFTDLQGTFPKNHSGTSTSWIEKWSCLDNGSPISYLVMKCTPQLSQTCSRSTKQGHTPKKKKIAKKSPSALRAVFFFFHFSKTPNCFTNFRLSFLKGVRFSKNLPNCLSWD